MTLRLRMVLGFAIIVTVFIAMVGATMISLSAFQSEDRILATDVSALSALRDVETALLREEAALDRYIASSDASLKTEFEGPARAATDAALAAAKSALAGHYQLTALQEGVAAWRKKTEIDVLTLASQPSTQAAKDAVHKTLSTVVGAMQQNIAAAQARKGQLEHQMSAIGWGATTVAFAVAIAAAWLLTRSIQRPIMALTATVDALAAGDLDAVVTGADRRDEIGRLARSMEIFRASAIENRRLNEQQEALKQRSAAERAEAIRGIADALEQRIAGTMAMLTELGGTLDKSSLTMSSVAERTAERSSEAAAAAEQATAHVESVAAATEELIASGIEIGRQIALSSETSHAAASEAEQANTIIGGLANAAGRIGEVVKLIEAIAAKTNLLALNATIEAARAGEVGKGFAVVAGEVKALASQTGKATHEIATQIVSVQTETNAAVAAIRHIFDVINRVDEATTSIAGVLEEQNAAINEISQSAVAAAAGTRTVSGHVLQVSGDAATGRKASNEVVCAVRDIMEQNQALGRAIAAFVTEMREAAP